MQFFQIISFVLFASVLSSEIKGESHYNIVIYIKSFKMCLVQVCIYN